MTNDREIAPDELADDDDLLDGSGVDYKDDAVDDNDLDFVVLSPEGDKAKLDEYARLFGVAR